MDTLQVGTRQRVEFIDITRQVNQWLTSQSTASGVLTLFVPHTTAGIMIYENADPDMIRDLTVQLDKLVPFEDNYRHAEGNAAAHIKATFIGSSVHVPVEGGQLQLGTWQGIFFAEFDGPRRRRSVQMQLLGAASG